LREGERGLLRLELPIGCVELRARRLEGRALLVDFLGGDGARLLQSLNAIVLDARVLEVRRRPLSLCLGDCETGRRLPNLLGRFLLLELERFLALLDLDGEAFCAVRVKRPICLELVRGDDGEQLVLRHTIALANEKLSHLSPDLRADDDVVRRHDAGQHERA
jgi:hypothetical protein